MRAGRSAKIGIVWPIPVSSAQYSASSCPARPASVPEVIATMYEKGIPSASKSASTSGKPPASARQTGQPPQVGTKRMWYSPAKVHSGTSSPH